MKISTLRLVSGRQTVIGYGNMSCRWHRLVSSILATVILTAGTSMSAGATVSGDATSSQSPNNVEEHCIALARMPGGAYSDDDIAVEKSFCSMDFYTGTHALCPKVFSTSPGTLVYDISRGPFSGKPEAFEAEQCSTSSPVKRGALGEPVSYKTTMNESHTSATFSTSSLLYYHFSRYLHADVHVPVSVYRSMDKDAHFKRVTRSGLELSAHRKGGAMNHAGWQVMEKAEKDPASYRAVDELFTHDRTQIYGVLIHPQGDRYSAEVNGTRQSGWGEGQNRDFQETAPFLALRSEKALPDAIEEGIHKAASNKTLRQAMRHGVSPEQMVFWMKELTEITLLDYIFSQQDRIGNIEYLSYWYWVDDGKLMSKPASGTQVPEEIAAYHPINLRRTQLNDNDAGGRVQYANFTKKTGMLEKIRHYSADTYRRLIGLDNDFSKQGELYAYVRDTFGLAEDQFRQIVNNTREAADILRTSCQSGKLRFDLDPETFLITGKADEQKIDCDSP